MTDSLWNGKCLIKRPQRIGVPLSENIIYFHSSSHNFLDSHKIYSGKIYYNGESYELMFRAIEDKSYSTEYIVVETICANLLQNIDISASIEIYYCPLKLYKFFIPKTIKLAVSELHCPCIADIVEYRFQEKNLKESLVDKSISLKSPIYFAYSTGKYTFLDASIIDENGEIILPDSACIVGRTTQVLFTRNITHSNNITVPLTIASTSSQSSKFGCDVEKLIKNHLCNINTSSRSVLLCGAPGSCKTTLVLSLCQFHNIEVVHITTGILWSRREEKADKILQRLLMYAYVRKRCVVLFDDLDSIIDPTSHMSDSTVANTNYESVVQSMLKVSQLIRSYSYIYINIYTW
jgi:hypothetical protein